jgi:hypothetical protein
MLTLVALSITMTMSIAFTTVPLPSPPFLVRDCGDDGSLRGIAIGPAFAHLNLTDERN